jgi:hypothetical protein
MRSRATEKFNYERNTRAKNSNLIFRKKKCELISLSRVTVTTEKIESNNGGGNAVRCAQIN